MAEVKRSGRVAAGLACLMILAACGGAPAVPVQVIGPVSAPREAARDTNYELGEPVSATVGGTLIRVREFVRAPPDSKPGSTVAGFEAALDTNFEIMFSGQDASSIRLQYREYTRDNMARAAFAQDLTYPRTAERIRFRDYEMRVLSLTDDELTVAVESEPPLPDLGGR